jgi:hypothetical protein
MKTGTSYLQSVLEQDKDLLASRDVFWPGASWKDQRLAVQDLLASGRRGGSLNSWQPFVDQLLAARETTSLVSMEFLSFAPAEIVERAMKSLGSARVRVVLTVRDLGRAIPAQWQESMQNMHDWSYREYLDGLMSYPDQESKAGRHFWVRQNWAQMLRNWQPWVAPEDLVLVTLPPSGGAPQTLWIRFCEAVGIDSQGFDLEGFENDSLGAVSAELMHRISIEARRRGYKPPDFQVFKRVLAKRVLAKRRPSEPAIVVPSDRRPWVEQRSRELLDEVSALGPQVVGDLNDLIPNWPERPEGTQLSDMQGVSDTDLLETAIDGFFGMAAAIQRRSKAEGKR